MTHYTLDENGNPVRCDSVIEWARFFERADLRRLASTEVGPYEVSTVFLGTDHAFDGGPPVLWETMVFEDGSGWLESDRYTQRYRSREEALIGHNQIVNRLEEELQP